MKNFLFGLLLIITPVFSQENISVVGVDKLAPGSSVNINIDGKYTNYQWYRNGKIIEGANNCSFSVTEAGSYYVAYTDSILKYSNKIDIDDANIVTISANEYVNLPTENEIVVPDSITEVSSQNNKLVYTNDVYKSNVDCSNVKLSNNVVVALDTLNVSSTIKNKSDNYHYLIIDIIGGMAPYTIVLSDETQVKNYNTNDRIKVLPQINTIYSVKSVTDANGCSLTNISGSAAVIVKKD